MATPRVTLKSKTPARGSRTFYLDYRVKGKRMRPNSGPFRACGGESPAQYAKASEVIKLQASVCGTDGGLSEPFCITDS
jgi:hypothetical protein